MGLLGAVALYLRNATFIVSIVVTLLLTIILYYAVGVEFKYSLIVGAAVGVGVLLYIKDAIDTATSGLLPVPGSQ